LFSFIEENCGKILGRELQGFFRRGKIIANGLRLVGDSEDVRKITALFVLNITVQYTFV
jgi:hypothetical protein